MAIHYHESQLEILDYNRVLNSINGMTKAQFLERIGENYVVSEIPAGQDPKPKEKFNQSLYIENQWYNLKVKQEKIDTSSPINVLEC
mmetsp:Transcript_17790/g.17013  ORF Transcript_17790/g.17013 Transcript_17790/m.17013 type:complete len:87 (+) Transcript_17790:454-714(+)